MNNNMNYYFGSTQAKQHALTITFAWMVAGLALTGFCSLFFTISGLYYWILYRMPFLVFGLLIVQIGIAFGIGAAMRSASSTMIKVLYLVYAVTLGINMTSICYAYNLGTICMAFFTTAIYFVCLCVVGLTSKRDLSSIGTICFAALIALLITQVIMAIFGFNMNTRLLSIVGLLIFSGLTAWDMQRMNQLLITTDGYPVEQEKVSIFMAMQLYLDFINIFLYILRLFGNNSRRN